MSAWKRYPSQIIDEIDNEIGVDWDTDANIATLNGFIESHCTEQDFEQYVKQRAIEDKYEYGICSWCYAQRRPGSLDPDRWPGVWEADTHQGAALICRVCWEIAEENNGGL